ncbi:hypothetical protein F5X97DRAFT_345805 [Nemania serpens]|nr:hypothetical protein F5X97DRAFT_345805 [Nemania serpens]
MASPRNILSENWTFSPENITEMPLPDTLTPPDTPPTNPIWELAELDEILANLAQEAAECYQARLEYDTRSALFRPRDAEREHGRAHVDARLAGIRGRAEIFKRKRAAARSRIAARRLPTLAPAPAGADRDRDPVDDLDAVFFQIEQQRLAGVIGTVDYADEQFVRARMDADGVQDPAVRDVFEGAMDKLQDAIMDFRRACDDCVQERFRVIDNELMRINSRPGPRQQQSSSPSSLSSLFSSSSSPSPSDDDDADSGLGTGSNNSSELDTDASLSDSLAPLTLDPAVAQRVCEMTARAAGAREYMTELVFRFERGDPPTLLRLANWLGLGDAVHAAFLLNSGPVQSAFANYSAGSRPSGSIAADPGRLRVVLALDVFSRDTLLAWRAGAGSGREERDRKTEKWSGVDFDAALFANVVVRFLENGCDEVEWEPLAGQVARVGDYDVAKRRWAIVLQMLWFLEKAFAPGESEGVIFI